MDEANGLILTGSPLLNGDTGVVLVKLVRLILNLQLYLSYRGPVFVADASANSDF